MSETSEQESDSDLNDAHNDQDEIPNNTPSPRVVINNTPNPQIDYTSTEDVEDQVLTVNDNPKEFQSSKTKEDAEMLNMFASVWVKVEVDEGDQEYLPSAESSNERNSITTKKKRGKRKISNEFQCDLCPYSTAYKNCLEHHVKTHNTTKPHACETCDYTTKYPTSLYRHVMIQHKNKGKNDSELEKELKKYKCEQCDYTSFYKWNLSAHKRKHNLKKQFKCSKCDFETAYRHNYVKHSKTHKEIVFYKCDKCPYLTKFEGHITRHLAQIHHEIIEKAHKCDFCDFATKVKWRLNIHKQRSKQENPVKCIYCGFESMYTCEVKHHKISHYDDIYVHKTLPKPHEVNPETLAFHNNIITQKVEEPKDYSDMQSEIEQSTTDQKYKIDPDCVDWNSIEVLISEDAEKPFMCHMCDYTSKFKAAVQRHFQRHHTGPHNRPYKCCHCDFSTKTKDQIALHNKRSQSDKKLICGNVCKFTTYFKCELAMHQKCHYPYKCTICSYTCRQKYDLQKHFSGYHLGNGVKCRFCDYKSVRKESVLCHETIHTGVKPFKCTICDYTSVRKSLLDNHVKRYHSDVRLPSERTIVTESKIESLKVVEGDICEDILMQCSEMVVENNQNTVQ